MISHTGNPISRRQKDKVPPVHQIIPGVRGVSDTETNRELRRAGRVLRTPKQSLMN